jgi:2-dehydro-3-deoxyphosphogluconate aldolase/(4S)-4-hydroxy-2-oxoglutarate aldolase
VTQQTAADFLKAGARALGVGADLVNNQAIADGRPEVVTAAARAYIEIIRRSRE